MKPSGFVTLSILFLLIFTAPYGAYAQTPGASASGTYRLVMQDDLTKYVDFSASTDERGTTTGQMTFIDTAQIPDVDDPEDPRQGDAPPELDIKVSLDSLAVEKNRALMGGTVVDSTHATYIGKYVQLVVEDNGVNNPDRPDRLVWTFCKPQPGGWVPSDAELRFDDGAYLHWWATDAERKDDVGIPSRDLLGTAKSCPVYTLATYDFADVLKGDGDIVVIQP